jgi:hypothetical protein
MTKSIGDKQVVEKIKLAYGITLENQMPKCNEVE